MIPGVDVRKLPLTPTDGYLLTRVNGQATVREIARETGLFEGEVIEAFEKLVTLHVVTFGSVEEALAALNPPAPLKPQMLTARYDATELEEICDLDIEQRKRVLDLFYAMEDNDYYTLLGIAKESDKRAIKRAYYEVALPMHPDKFFRKNLGSFKPKMESVFNRLTVAHDTLLDKDRRAEYDVYLREVAHTKGMEAMLARAMDEARTAQQAAAATAAADAAATAAAMAAIPSAPPPSAAPGVDPAVLAARRQALAARLMGGRGRVSAPPVSAQVETVRLAPVVQQSSNDAMDALKRRFTDRLADARAAQVTKYVQAAEGAAAKNDWVASANAYRIAEELAPEDPEIARASLGAQTQANMILGDSYTKQAVYDERNENWPGAMRAWTRVAKLKPQDAHANERAAHSICKAQGDYHEAAQLAQNAVKIQPNIMGHRITLANVYIAAGKPLLARRELESAAQVAPTDVGIQSLLKRIPK